MSEMQKLSRRWVFRVSNYSVDDVRIFTELVCVYVCFGKEVGEMGTPHLQGYAVFGKPCRGSFLKKIHPSAYWASANGTTAENVTYCSKEGLFFEKGVRPMEKERVNKLGGDAEKRRWEDAFDSAKRGDLDSIPADIRLKYWRNLKSIKTDYMPDIPDAEDVTGVWIYGPAGCGKSRMARSDYPGAYLKRVNKWFDGYQDQDYVIVDDIDLSHGYMSYDLKMWADRYAFAAETKGGMIKIRPKKIIVTSQYRIEDIWADSETRDALNRRFKIINIPPIVFG